MSDIIHAERLEKFGIETDPFDEMKVPDHMTFRYREEQKKKGQGQEFQPLVTEAATTNQAATVEQDPADIAREEEYRRLVDLASRLSDQIDSMQAQAAESESKEQEAYERGLADGERRRTAQGCCQGASRPLT